SVVRLPDPKLKTLGERVSIYSIIESKDAIFDENRFSSVPKLRQGSFKNGTKNIGGSVIPKEVTKEVVVQQPELELRKSKRNRTLKNFGPEFQLYLIKGTKDEVSDQHSYCFNVEDDPKIFNEAMKSQDGFRQKSGIDYFDTYALVARISTIRLLIALASIHSLIIHQMDVRTAFLNDELEEEKAPKQCHQKFDEVVLSSGYLLNQANKCVYSKFDEDGKGVIICLYVDDMLIFGTDQVQVDLTKEFLSSRFCMKDMGEADVILGIRIKHESNVIVFSQSYYIEMVLKKFNYFDYTPVSTPIDTSEKLMPNNGQAVSQLEYSKVIGCPMYAMTCIRPDITFAVVLKGYTDASWIRNTKDNSSTSGWGFLLGRAAGKEAEWLRNLILEIPLWSKPIAPISFHCDSAATLEKAYSQMYNEKSRHLGVRHSMIHEIIMNGVVSIEFVRYSNGLKGLNVNCTKLERIVGNLVQLWVQFIPGNGIRVADEVQLTHQWVASVGTFSEYTPQWAS
ncbi:zinc finger, CCHC-type containing protein, partial [Tanacetum coccineum]